MAANKGEEKSCSKPSKMVEALLMEPSELRGKGGAPMVEMSQRGRGVREELTGDEGLKIPRARPAKKNKGREISELNACCVSLDQAWGGIYMGRAQEEMETPLMEF